jgi:hypothetical protein
MKVLAGIAILPLMIASALAQEVNYNFSKEANFAVFRTYAWVDIKGGSVDQLDQLTAKQLTSAIDAEFGRKGLRPAPAAQADLLVGFQAAITQERSITAYNTGWGYGPGWRAGGISSAQTSTILVGAFALDIYDRTKKELVWRGTATKTIDVGAKPEKREQNIRKGVQKLLKHYPPPAK